MTRKLFIGLGAAALVLCGWLFYTHTPKVPPAPRDLATVLPKQLLEKANSAQLAVLHGEASSAPKAAVATGGDPSAAPAVAAAEGASPASTEWKVALTADGHGLLTGQVTNLTESAAVYDLPPGAMFSNGTGEMVLLKHFSLEVPARGTASVSLPVAQTSSSQGLLAGDFQPRGDVAPPERLGALLALLVHKNGVPTSVAQTAVLVLNDDVPLDVIASFPRLRPPALTNNGPKPFSVAPADLISALALIREAGVDPAASALMSEPQLKVMTLLNPESHATALDFYGLTQQTEWTFWKRQLLEGDPALRHYALYGIARYYPEVALEMLPRWVREPNVYRSYRISAAWALALIDDPRAQSELRHLRTDLAGDAGLRQALDRALSHWGTGAKGRVAGNQAS